MDAWHLNQAAVAARLGISPGTVSGWIKKGALPQPRIRIELADIFDVTPEWLAYGKEPKLSEAARRRGEQAVSNLPVRKDRELIEQSPSYPKSKIMEIPLISWAQAGIATEFEELPEHWQERIPALVSDRLAFAIQLRGDSMEPKYSDGDVAIVIPSSTARNGDLVIANIKDEGFAFKIMTLVGGDPRHVRLTSYNPAYPPMDFDREQFHWMHPVYSVNKIIRR